MILDRVTLTGADDSIKVFELAGLSQRFPFVEWGILHGSRQGVPRYPSLMWRGELRDLAKVHWGDINLKLSAHLCSGWVRDFVLNGKYTFGQNQDNSVYQRVQLNFHAHHHPASSAFIDAMREAASKEFIFQMDEVNDQLWKSSWEADLPAVPLFDTSGGAGILPRDWPAPYPGVYCGYAGGLGPHNLEGQLRAIAHAAPGDARVWVDMETRIRSDDDSMFDLDKCRKVLEIAEPFIGRRM